MTSIVHIKGEWTKLLVITDNDDKIEQIEKTLTKMRGLIENDTKLSEIEILKCVKSDFTVTDLSNTIKNNLPPGSSFVMIATTYDREDKQLMIKVKRPLKRYGNYWSLKKLTTTSVKKLILEVNHQARGINYKCPTYELFDGKHIFGHIAKFGKGYIFSNGNESHIVTDGNAKNHEKAISLIIQRFVEEEEQKELKDIFITVSADEIDSDAIEKMHEYAYNKYSHLPQDILTTVSLKADCSIDAKVGNLSDTDINRYINYLRNIDPLRESNESISTLPYTIELMNTKRGMNH